MNPSTAGLPGDYQVDYKVTTPRISLSTTCKPVRFTFAYNQVTNTVTLNLTNTKKFAKGGQITISGVTDQAGTALDASDILFTITNNAKNITRG